MPKNIVVCSDGTGNSGGKRHGTNVWRIFNAVDRYRLDCKQITYYDDGVGTHDVRLLRLLGGAFGWGLSRNIREAYEFLALNYKEGDRIFLFGFSRGAFTVRSLAGMICRCGLLERDTFITASRRKRERYVKQVLHAYRSETRPFRCGSKQIRGVPGLRTVDIHFVGVWDTVDAVGVPFDELKKWVDLVWRHLFHRRLWDFHDLKPHPRIRNAFQALALDDERKTFHPLVWNVSNAETKDPAESAESDRSDASCTAGDDGKPRVKQVIRQVWFAGMHSNVGGGYPKDALALVPLLWMMHRAHDCGLRFLRRKWDEFSEDADPHGRLYDSRNGWGIFYRYARRDPYAYKPDGAPEAKPAVHESVLERIARATDYYAPKILRPSGFTVVSGESVPERD